MASRETSFPAVRKVYQDSFLFLKNSPIFFYPFLILIFLEVFSILVLFSIPRAPLNTILGPIIKVKWGERFLHYPLNFFLLPKLVSYARIVLAVIFGSLLTGMAVSIASDGFNNKKPKLGRSFIVSLKKYLFIFIVIALFNISWFFIERIIPNFLVKYFVAGHTRLLFINYKLWQGPISTALNFLLAVIFQSIFIYIIPVFIIENKKFFPSIISAFGFLIRYLKITLTLVLLPMLSFIIIIILNYNSLFLMDKFFPGIILLLIFLGTLLINLVIDPLITASTTLFYLNKRERS